MFCGLIFVFTKWYNFGKYEIELLLYVLFLYLMLIFSLDLLNN
jgi:hypothetical protein